MTGRPAETGPRAWLCLIKDFSVKSGAALRADIARPTPVMTAISHSREDFAESTPGSPLYWRVEGSLLELSALRQVGFFTWNSQSFAERWRRRVGMALMTLS